MDTCGNMQYFARKMPNFPMEIIYGRQDVFPRNEMWNLHNTWHFHMTWSCTLSQAIRRI